MLSVGDTSALLEDPFFTWYDHVTLDVSYHPPAPPPSPPTPGLPPFLAEIKENLIFDLGNAEGSIGVGAVILVVVMSVVCCVLFPWLYCWRKRKQRQLADKIAKYQTTGTIEPPHHTSLGPRAICSSSAP